ncbi:GNAT family N-acetyltransferase [Streptomyces ziwulingensis]|uniref:GNAT family protein n=1 Tax=Streptomyces ziwulingensis TaxID=1045501 RepID=A0ABP9B0C1_9ACTN
MHPVQRSDSHLFLRELLLTDVEAVYAVYGSQVATEHLSFEPRTLQQVEGIVTRSIAAATASPRTEYGLAVVDQTTADLVGFGRLALDPHQQRGATIGFALHPGTWGGYGTETVRLLLSLAFEDLRLHRVRIEEGTIPEHVMKASVWRDSVVHSILDREWTGQPSTDR